MEIKKPVEKKVETPKIDLTKKEDRCRSRAKNRGDTCGRQTRS